MEGFTARALWQQPRRATHQNSTAKQEAERDDSRINTHKQISTLVRLSGQRAAGVGHSLGRTGASTGATGQEETLNHKAPQF